MQMNISQQMKMSQVMKMSPRMIQSMEILQLTVMALNERIEAELVENPCLEAQIKDEDLTDTERRAELERQKESAEKATDQKELVSDKDNEADFERLVEAANEWPEDNLWESSRPSANRISDQMDRAHDTMANAVERPNTLHEHLIEQFRIENAPPHVKKFGEYLIHNLDHNGRLQGSLPEIVQVYGTEISLEDAETALGIIQRLDPPGVGARDLPECLLLQITPDMAYRDVISRIIREHLDDLVRNRLPLIEKKIGIPMEEIKEAILEMRKLDPFPGRSFEVMPTQRVTPDCFLEKDKEGNYTVRLENESTPTLRISKRYAKMLENGKADGDTKDYIKKKIESARWLIESIEQRQNTLKRVAQAIVDHQTEFIAKGPEHIQPLKMQQIADQVGVHVTTISRAVDDKWIQTPRGLFPLRDFFGGGKTNADGEDVAYDVIRLKLQEVIDAEDKSKPLSDDALVKELKKQGLDIARRTVTKYRKIMNIPSSRQRKEY